MVTPAHIVPEWYFLPFYAMLRAVPDKLGGVLVMLISILILFFLPLLGATSNTRSAVFRPIYRIFFWFFIMDVLLLGWLGACVVEEPYITISRILTVYYFSFFIIFVPILGLVENKLAQNCCNSVSSFKIYDNEPSETLADFVERDERIKREIAMYEREIEILKNKLLKKDK